MRVIIPLVVMVRGYSFNPFGPRDEENWAIKIGTQKAHDTSKNITE